MTEPRVVHVSIVPTSGERKKFSAPRTVVVVSPCSMVVAAVVVAFGLVLFVGFQYVDYQRGEGAKSGADAVSAPPLPAASQPAAPIAAPAAPPGKGMEHANGFSVRLRDSSWVWVQVDGKVVMEGSYPKGTQRTFAGRSATIRVGNAGGVDIGVDGKDLGPMGGLGDVAERSFQL